MLTQSERRGLSLLVLVFAIGAARDLWTWHQLGRPHAVPAPPAAVSGGGGSPPAPAPAPDEGGALAPGAGSPAAELIDLNRASAEELDRLPGIGPVLAGRILEHRARHGPFRQPDDLLAVPGIGPRLLERVTPRIRLGPPGPGSSAVTTPRR